MFRLRAEETCRAEIKIADQGDFAPGFSARHGAGMSNPLNLIPKPPLGDWTVKHRKDWISGEEGAYLYDQFGRLTSAETAGPEWGHSFVYDGFGNMTQQVNG
mgnify:CR=1 FL=1